MCQQKVGGLVVGFEVELGRHSEKSEKLLELLDLQQKLISTFSQRLAGQQQYQESSEEDAYTKFADKLTHLKTKFELNCKHRKETSAALAEYLRSSKDRVEQAIAKEKRDR